MRDIALFCFVMGMLPVSYMQPIIGLMMWTWISYMLPHKLTWGFAQEFRFVYFVAIATIIGSLMQKNKNFNFPFHTPSVLWIAFTLWATLTTLTAAYPDQAYMEWNRFIKIQVMVMFTYLLVQSKRDINILIWVIVLSLGFWGIKGGVWTLIHGGANRVYGPAGSFFYDNNTLSLTLNMTVPLMGYLQMHAHKRYLRMAMLVIMILTVIATLGTYSRGGLVGCIAMLGFLWLKNRQRIAGTLLVIVFLGGVYNFMPEKWLERMHSITSFAAYQSDKYKDIENISLAKEWTTKNKKESQSFSVSSVFSMIKDPDLADPNLDLSMKGRINAWNFVWNMIHDYPILGGGFNVFRRGHMYWEYGTGANYNDAHSIYFEVLGEQGIPGLLIFLSMYLSGFLMASRTIRFCRDQKDLAWARDLSAMIQVSLVGYFITGLTLGMAYFDLPYHLLSIIVITHVIAMRESRAQESTTDQDKKPIQSIFTNTLNNHHTPETPNQ